MNLTFIGYARAGQDLCEIYKDGFGGLHAKNPMDNGYNWVSSGEKYKPFSGTVYAAQADVPPPYVRPQPAPAPAVLSFVYGPPGCECGCLCCEDCGTCNAYRNSGHFDSTASAGMFVLPGHEAQAKKFMLSRGDDPDLLS